jgi:hypothetical protein
MVNLYFNKFFQFWVFGEITQVEYLSHFVSCRHPRSELAEILGNGSVADGLLVGPDYLGVVQLSNRNLHKLLVDSINLNFGKRFDFEVFRGRHGI